MQFAPIATYWEIDDTVTFRIACAFINQIDSITVRFEEAGPIHAIPLKTQNWRTIDTIPVGHTFLTEGITRVVATCWIANGYGTIHDTVEINIGRVPHIEEEIQSKGPTLAGKPLQLFVAAGGTEPLSYQWYFNANVIVNAISDTLAFATLSSAHAGQYTCSITNSYGTITTPVFNLVIDNGQTNHSPRFALNAVEYSIKSDSTLKCTLQVSDSDGDSLSFDLLDTAGIVRIQLDVVSGGVTFTFSPQDTGTSRFRIVASDGHLADTTTITIHSVAPETNSAPLFVRQEIFDTIDVQDTFRLSLVASDADGSALVFTILGSGGLDSSTLSLRSLGDTATLQINHPPAGALVILIGVSDSILSDTATVNLFVRPIDQTPPRIRLTGPVVDSMRVATPDCQLAVVVKDDTDSMPLVTFYMGSDTFVVQRTQDSIYSTTIRGLPRDSMVAITIRASDRAARSDSLIVHLIYDPTAQDSVAPIITLLSHTHNQIVTTTPILIRVKVEDISPIASVIINGQNAAADSTGYSRSVSLVADSTPITIIATDMSANRNTDTLLFVVIYNQPPIAGTVDTIKTTEDDPNPKSVNLSGSDSPGSSLRWYIVDAPRKGVLSADSGTISPGSECTYTPKPDSCGIDSFTYVVHDGFSTSAAVTVYIAIAAVNDAPIITGQKPLSFNEDTLVSIQLSDILVSDIDNVFPVGFSLEILDQQHYDIINPTQVMPTTDFCGQLKVRVRVSDPEGLADTADLDVTIHCVNDLPTIHIVWPQNGDSISFGESFTVDVTWFDAEGIDSVFLALGDQEVSQEELQYTYYQTIWTPQFGPDVIGDHVIRMRVIDTDGVMVEDSVVVRVKGTWVSDSLSVQKMLDITTPSVALSQVAGKDGDGRIISMQFWISAYNIDVPPEIKNLTELKSFRVESPPRGGTHQIAFCPEFGFLNKLETLLISYCNLSELPTTIGQLSNLKGLYISYSNLTSLPEEIGELTGMLNLGIGNNQLTDLPKAISRLENIPVGNLNLSQNFLNSSSPNYLFWNDWATLRDSDWAATQKSR